MGALLIAGRMVAAVAIIVTATVASTVVVDKMRQKHVFGM
jgi:hypothetical protein